MTVSTTGRSVLARAMATAGFAAVVGGLPIAVELAGTGDRAMRGGMLAHADTAFVIDRPVRLSDRLPLTIDGGRIASIETSNSDDGRGPSVIAIDDAALTLDLSDRRSPTEAATAAQASEAVKVPRISTFSSGALQLRRATVSLIGPRAAKGRLSDVNATVTVTRKGGYKLIGTGHLNGQRVAIDAVWTDTGARDVTTQVPLRLTLRSAVLDATLDGLFRTGDVPSFVGQAEFRMPSLRRFIAWAGLGRGVGEQLQSIVVAGPLEWSPSQMAFARATVGVNGNQATGAMTIKHADDRLSVDGTFGFQELDLGRHLPGLLSRHVTPGSEPHVLTVIDADLRLSAGKVIAPAIETGRAAVSVALKKGRLQIDMAELEIESGSAGGQLWADLNEASPKANLKMKLRGVDVGRVLAEPLRRNPLLGKANVTFEGTVGGRTLGEAVATLAGRGNFDLVEPGRLGLDLTALVHAAKASAVVGWSAAGKGGTTLESLSGRFRVLNGALTLETVLARSGSQALVGSGRIDVPGRLLDMSVAAGPANGGDQQLASQEVLLMRGTWDQPSISLYRPLKPDLKVEVPAGLH